MNQSVEGLPAIDANSTDLNEYGVAIDIVLFECIGDERLAGNINPTALCASGASRSLAPHSM